MSMKYELHKMLSRTLANFIEIRLPKSFSALYLQSGADNDFESLISARLDI